MQPLVLGEHKEGELTYIPRNMLSESVIGQIYEVHVRTQSLLGLGGASKKNIANIIIQELPKRVPGLKLKWIRVEDTMIKIQFVGSPFPFALLLLMLPEILSLVGITVSLIGVYLVWRKIPSSALAIIALGIALFYLAPIISKLARKAIRETRGA